MNLDDETLMAYADGEPEQAMEIKAALATRPALAARVAEMRALRKTVSGAFTPIVAETPPAYLAALLRRPRKVHPADPAVIKSPPIYPFVALTAAAVALIACIVTAPKYIPMLQSRVVAGTSESILAPPAIAPKRKATVFALPQPPALAPLLPPPIALVYADAVWVQQPDARTIERYYPALAAAQDIRGKAVLDCLVNLDGSVGCVVSSESPGDWGFGAAAMEVARHFLLAEKAANGMRTVDGRITIPITFAPRNCVAAPSPITFGATVITSPIWIEKPNASDFARFYPRRAAERGKAGRANVHCLVALDGALTNCIATNETPAGWGFGDAAIRIAQRFQTAPQTAKGEPTAGRVIDLPISFKPDP